MLLGPIDFSSNEIVKRIELCFSSFKGQSVPFPQPSLRYQQTLGSSALVRPLVPLSSDLQAQPLDHDPAKGGIWGVCFISALRNRDIICEIKCGDPHSKLKSFHMVIAALYLFI